MALLVAVAATVHVILTSVDVGGSGAVLLGSGWGLYSKLREHRVLASPRREALYRAIRENPGIPYGSLAFHASTREGSLPLAPGALTHHLAQLERFGLVVSRRIGRHRRFFEAGVATQVRTVDRAVIASGPLRHVVDLVRAWPGIGCKDLHARTAPLVPLSRPGLAYHVHRLVARDLVRVHVEGRKRFYWPTQRLEAAVEDPAASCATGPLERPQALGEVVA